MSLPQIEAALRDAEPVAPDAGASQAPKYIRIRDWLLDRILSAGLTRGDRLPSESDLVRQFDVSRVTVRQALEALRTDGIVESRHGKGWFLRRVRAVQNSAGCRALAKCSSRWACGRGPRCSTLRNVRLPKR